MLAGQAQGSIVAQVAIDVETDALISAWGLEPGGVTVITPSTAYAFFLNKESSTIPIDAQQVCASVRQFKASLRLLPTWQHDGGDPENQVSIELIDPTTGAAQAGVAGDVLTISVYRVNVPT